MRKLLLAGVFLTASLANAAVTKEPWGKTADGAAVDLYTVTDGDLTVTLTSYGAHVVSITAPGDGKLANVVLGYKDLAGYEAEPDYPSTELQPGKTIDSTTVFTFGVQK